MDNAEANLRSIGVRNSRGAAKSRSEWRRIVEENNGPTWTIAPEEEEFRTKFNN